MSPSASLVATLTEAPSEELLDGLAGDAAILEVRADLAGELDPGELRRRFPGELLYTLRSTAEGGAGPDDPGRRGERLAAAAAAWDLVDLEGRDLKQGLEHVPAAKRLISWHGRAADLASLRGRLERLDSVESRYVKLVPSVQTPGDALLPLELLRDLGRDDVVAFAGGPTGAWTRLLAPRLGAPLVYGAAGATPGAAGQPRLERLRAEFGLPELAPGRELFGIVGRPVRDSLSPLLHNSLYRLLGLGGLYLPFEVDRFGDFWLEVVEGGALSRLGFDLRGLSVTAPHKEVALAVAGASSPLVERLGCANTLTLHEGVWEAESTDPDGVAGPLQARGLAVAGRRAAVLGAGGAGRAAAFALARGGAELALVNRSVERGVRAAARLGVAFLAPAAFDPGGFSLVVNATPVGGGGDESLPFDPARLPQEAVVIDLVYRRHGATPLVAAARERGLTAIDGREVLLHQAAAQFETMRGQPMPFAAAADLLGLEGWRRVAGEGG